ncbi:hypothetical protein ACWEJ6_23555 [Nonomuraea sp. NPDC004702]
MTRTLASVLAVIGLTITGLSSSPAHAAADPIVRIINQGTGDCIDAGTGNVHTRACNKEAGKPEEGWQLWRLHEWALDVYSLESVRFPGRCLTGRDEGTDGVVLAGCSTDASQRWFAMGWRFPGAFSSIDNYFSRCTLYDEAGTLDLRVHCGPINPVQNGYWTIKRWS